MRLIWSLPLLAILVARAPVALADPPQMHVGVIERVVAVVGHQAIFLSELRARGKPFDRAIEKAMPDDGAKRAAAHSQMQAELLDKLIDERIVASEAARMRVDVSPAEIDMAIQSIMTQQKLTRAELLTAAADQGLSEADYRDELRRQVLEGKMLQIVIRAQLKDISTLSEVGRAQRLESERRMWIDGIRQKTFIEKRL